MQTSLVVARCRSTLALVPWLTIRVNRVTKFSTIAAGTFPRYRRLTGALRIRFRGCLQLRGGRPSRADEDPELIVRAELVGELRLTIPLEHARLEVTTLDPFLRTGHLAESYSSPGFGSYVQSSTERATPFCVR